MQYKINSLFLLLFLLVNLTIQANSPQIHGVVLDETTKEPIIGAAIILEGSTIGTTTDFDGNFTISNIPTGTYDIKVQYISYVPYNLSNITIDNSTSKYLEVLLKEDNILLADVVVVAQAKRNTHTY